MDEPPCLDDDVRLMTEGLGWRIYSFQSLAIRLLGLATLSSQLLGVLFECLSIHREKIAGNSLNI